MTVLDFSLLQRMTQMDVNTPPASSSKRPAASPPAFSSADKRIKILLPEAQLNTLCVDMKKKSDMKKWRILVEEAKDDERWMNLLSDILMHLTRELASTNMKGSVIANLTLEGAEEMVNSFNEDELEQWRVGVRNGIKSNDWLDLLECRTRLTGQFGRNK